MNNTISEEELVNDEIENLKNLIDLKLAMIELQINHPGSSYHQMCSDQQEEYLLYEIEEIRKQIAAIPVDVI